MSAFFGAIADMLFWNEHLTLLPLFVGIALYRLNYAYSTAAQVFGGVALLALMYAGLTAVGATLDVYTGLEKEFLLVLGVGAGQVVIGIALAYWFFGRYVQFEEQFFDKSSLA